VVVFSLNGCACFSSLTARADLVPEIVARAKRAVIQVCALDAQGNLLGTGTAFFVSSNGKAVTSSHVIRGASRVVGLSDTGAEYQFERVVSLPAGVDLAILKFSVVDAPYLTLGSSRTTVEGQRILVIGNPIGLHGTVSDGLISAFRADHSQIQITAPMWPESSGAPVLDEAGNVTRVAVLQLDSGQNLNFAIPVEQVIAALKAPQAQQSSNGSPENSKELGALISTREEAAIPNADFTFRRVLDSSKSGTLGLEGLMDD
jgi:S1-C subfamily serine protease